MSEFEQNLRELLLDMHGETDSQVVEQSIGTRKSERQKKPLTRLNEEAGYLAEPPKSTKKKWTMSDYATGTSSKLLFILDWTDA